MGLEFLTVMVQWQDNRVQTHAVDPSLNLSNDWSPAGAAIDLQRGVYAAVIELGSPVMNAVPGGIAVRECGADERCGISFMGDLCVMRPGQRGGAAPSRDGVGRGARQSRWPPAESCRPRLAPA